MIELQDCIGNQAVQRLLAQHGGKFDQKTIPHLKHENEGAVSNQTEIVSLGNADTVQRNEEGQEEPQPQPSNGEVTMAEFQTDYYDVTGGTLAEVAAQLDPEEWGRCTYHFDYSYETTGGRTNKVDITLRLIIRLPRWRGEGFDNASPAARREWQRMIEALHRHEDEHAAIARRWAPIFKERLLGQREGRVQARHQQTLREVDTETEAFDNRTQHGQTQGVTLDLSIE